MKNARDGILKAAIELFAQKGYAGCSIREICQAAGVTKPVLYYHFRSKEHLYQELMLDIFNHTKKNLLQLAQSRGSLRESLVTYVSNEFSNSKKDPSGVRLLFRMMFSPEGEYPRFNVIVEFKRERKSIAEFIRKNSAADAIPDPELVATALMGMMLIEILEFFFTRRQTLTRRSAEKLVDLLLQPSGQCECAIPSGIPLGVHA